MPGSRSSAPTRTRAPTVRSGVRHRPRVDRHRRAPAPRAVLAGRARDDPRRVHGREARFVTGKDLILAVIARSVSPAARTGSRVRRRRAPRRCRSTSGSPSRTWPSRPAPRPASSRPTRRRPILEGRTDQAVDGRAVRPGRRGRADAPRSTWTGSPRSSPSRTPRATSARSTRRSGARSTRCTSATARTGRSPISGRRRRCCAVGACTPGRAIIVPASQRVYRQAIAEGLIDVFVAAGARRQRDRAGLAGRRRATRAGPRRRRGGRGGDRFDPALPARRDPRPRGGARPWAERRSSPAR